MYVARTHIHNIFTHNDTHTHAHTPSHAHTHSLSHLHMHAPCHFTTYTHALASTTPHLHTLYALLYYLKTGFWHTHFSLADAITTNGITAHLFALKDGITTHAMFT